MSLENLSINKMTLNELELILTWASKEGWNTIHHAASAYYAADPNGFFVLKDGSNIIASLSRVIYPEGLGFIGLYIVESTLRHQGYGKYLWDKVTEDNDKYPCIALEGVMAQMANYEASGFILYDTTKRYRYQPKQLGALDNTIPDDLTLHESIDFETLQTYDQSIFSQNRKSFLKLWLQLPEAKFIAAKNQHGICGYGLLVKADEGYRLAPLFADTVEIAKTILTNLCQTLPQGVNVYLDIPDCNLPAQSLVDELALTEVFKTALMYYQGRQAQTQLDKVFSKTTLEIG